ncbi:MAG: ABC transporter ATP-binding protein, partial [Pseudohongiellaceae bacterium]
MDTLTPLLAVDDLFCERDERVLFQNLSFRLAEGQVLQIKGGNGSGKTTLLNLLGGLDLPSRGRVIIAGQDLAEVDETERGRIRNLYLGFVYQ